MPSRLRPQRPYRSRSQARPRGSEWQGQDWPLPHKKRVYPALTGQRRCNYREQPRDQQRRRDLPLVGGAEIHGYVRSWHDLPLLEADGFRFQWSTKTHSYPSLWRRRTGCDQSRVLPWIGREFPAALLARWTSLFGFSAFGGQRETKKARSVVALSRVPRGERGAPVSPPAAG